MPSLFFAKDGEKTMEKTWCVYKHTNKENGKSYIGVTSQSAQQRWRNGTGYKDNQHFYRAIQKYTWAGFYHEILAVGLTEAEAKDLEIATIKEFSSADKKYGYNVTHGGDGSLGHPHSEETRKRMSESRIGKYCGKNSHNYGRTLSDDIRKKMSAAKKTSYLGAGNPFYGKAHSEFSKQKISTTKLESGSSSERGVQCITTGKVYRSVSAASRDTGANISAICKCCTGKYRTTHGLEWKYITQLGGDNDGC